MLISPLLENLVDTGRPILDDDPDLVGTVQSPTDAAGPAAQMMLPGSSRYEGTSMSELTSTQPLVDLIRAQTDPGSPIVRAALERVAWSWADGAYDVADGVRLGMAAIAIQAVVAAEFPGLPALVVVGDALPLDVAMAVVLAAADVFASAARAKHPRAWEFAAAASQLRSAVEVVR